MTELKAIGLVDIEHANNDEFTENGHPAKVKIMRLKPNKFDWFLTFEFQGLRDSFTPVDNQNYMGEEDPEKEALEAAAKATYDTTTTTSNGARAGAKGQNGGFSVLDFIYLPNYTTNQ